MQTFLNNIYKGLIEFFLDKKPTEYARVYKEVAFSLTAWQTIGLTLLMALLFYYGMYNTRGPRPVQRWQWWTVFLLLTAGLGAAVAAYTSLKQGAVLTNALSRSYRTYFAFANALVAALTFFLWSMVVKWKSNDASRTPF
jgi:hypothetical protein